MTVVDASVWVSWFMSADANHAASRRWMERYVELGGLIVEPALVLAEVAGQISRRTGLARLGREARSRLLQVPRLQLVSLDTRLARLAAELAADLKLRGSDAVYVAAAQRLRVPLVTWDGEQRDRTTGTIITHTPDQLI